MIKCSIFIIEREREIGKESRKKRKKEEKGIPLSIQTAHMSKIGHKTSYVLILDACCLGNFLKS